MSLSGFTAILKRSPTPFLMNTYLPTGLLTVASFIGFLIPVDMVPGRMALLVTIFLMLVNIRSTEQRTGPVVSVKYHFEPHAQFLDAINIETFSDKRNYSHERVATGMHDVCDIGNI